MDYPFLGAGPCQLSSEGGTVLSPAPYPWTDHANLLILNTQSRLDGPTTLLLKYGTIRLPGLLKTLMTFFKLCFIISLNLFVNH